MKKAEPEIRMMVCYCCRTEREKNNDGRLDVAHLKSVLFAAHRARCIGLRVLLLTSEEILLLVNQFLDFVEFF